LAGIRARSADLRRRVPGVHHDVCGRGCELEFEDDPEHFTEPDSVFAMEFRRDFEGFAGTNFEIRWTAA
jgi:hypothetical protein